MLQFLALFWKNLCLFWYSFLSISPFYTLNIFKIRLDIPWEFKRCLIFVIHPDSLFASSSLKAQRKQSSFKKGFLFKCLNNCVSMQILKGNRPSSPNTFELLMLFLTLIICLQSESEVSPSCSSYFGIWGLPSFRKHKVQLA